ncbi:MAG: hypothetical protein AB1586_23375 [Pseudomonadota bacterium]|jgi:hypothetical protein
MVKIEECYFGVRSLVPEKPKRSEAAESVGRWGNSGYRIGRLVASLCLIIASLHTLLSAEQIAHRLLSLIFIGALPALVAYLLGYLSYRVLRAVSAIYDPAARVLGRIRAVIARVTAMVRDGYLRPGLAVARQHFAPFVMKVSRRGAALLRDGRAALVRARAVPLRPLIMHGWRTVFRVVTLPVRRLAGLLLRLQSPAAPVRRPA